MRCGLWTCVGLFFPKAATGPNSPDCQLATEGQDILALTTALTSLQENLARAIYATGLQNHLANLLSVQQTYHLALTKTGISDRAEQLRQEFESNATEILSEAGCTGLHNNTWLY